jgi:hypothetical protein
MDHPLTVDRLANIRRSLSGRNFSRRKRFRNWRLKTRPSSVESMNKIKAANALTPYQGPGIYQRKAR